MPIGFVHTWQYHLNSVGSKLMYYHSNGFRESIDSPLRSIQTRFCISWPTCTIQNHFGESTLYTVISLFKTTIANGFKWCINLYEKGTKSRRIKKHIKKPIKKHMRVTFLILIENLHANCPFYYLRQRARCTQLLLPSNPNCHSEMCPITNPLGKEFFLERKMD